MKRRLALLISDLTGCDAWLSPDAWSRVVMVNSFGRIPPHIDKPGDYLWNRGFDFVLLDRRGRAGHFCKCRSAKHATLRRAIDIQGRLCLDPELASVVPLCCGGSDGQLLVQVSAFIVGERFDRMSSRVHPAVWAASVQAVSAAATTVCARASAALPHLLPDPAPIVLAAVAAPPLETLRQASVPATDLDLVRRMLEAVAPLTRVLQHGDLWANNVIRGGGSWWLLDFDLFGEVQVPLYDTCCLLRSASEGLSSRRCGSEGGWLDWLVGDDRRARMSRQILASQCTSLGLTANQAVGALVFFLFDSAARAYSRGLSRALYAPFLTDVARVCRFLRAGDSLMGVFSPVQSSPRSARNLRR